MKLQELICQPNLLLVKSLTLTSTLSTYYERHIYEYSSSYYKVERYLIAYVEEIKLVPSEETWEVPIDILERKISSSFVEPAWLEEGPQKDIKKLGNHFQ